MTMTLAIVRLRVEIVEEKIGWETSRGYFDHFLDPKCQKVVFWQEKNGPARNAAVALEGLEPKSAKYKENHEK